MDFKQIKELIKLIDDSKIGELLIENDETSIRIRHQNYQKKANTATVVAASPVSASHAAPAPSSDTSAATKATDSDSNEENELDTSNLITVKSPMIGTFYRSSSPDKPPFAKVGDSVDKGGVLCIIEAMKLFNEIESEFSGKIVKVLIENESPVEYDQALFLIDPNA